MGLSVRDDPKKLVDIAGRQWGEAIDGLALSVILKPKEDEAELATVSAAIHNTNAQTRRVPTRGWLHFYEVSVTGEDNTVAVLSPYGRELMKPERQTALTDVTLAPGEAIEADIPVGLIFQVRKGRYRVRAAAALPGGRAISNEITITI